MKKFLLEDIMCEQPIKVSEDVRVGMVAHLLLRYRINGIFVVKKNDENQLVGVFTTTDLLKLLERALSNRKQKLKELKRVSDFSVGQVASKKVITLSKKTTIIKAVAIMHKKHVHTLPVYEDGKMVGVVGRHDILNAAFA